MTDTLLGTRVRHYRIVDLIATGGMGEVYVGYDEKLERKVALKSIRPEYDLHDEAESSSQRSLKIREKALGPDHPYVAEPLYSLAKLYTQQGKYSEAEPLLQRSLAIREKALGANHPDVALCLYGLAELNARRGKRAEALALLRRALPAGGDMPWMRSIGKEPDLVSLHGDPEFERIVVEVNKRAETKR